MNKFIDWAKRKAVMVFALLVIGGIIVWFSVRQPTQEQEAASEKPVSSNDIAVPGNYAVDLEGFPFLGNENAPVVFVEYGDYQCGFCGRFYQTVLPRFKQEFIEQGLVKFVYKDFILFGEESQKFAEATHCANDQGRFWDFHNYIFDSQGTEKQLAATVDNLSGVAQELGLEPEAFRSCLESGKYKQLVEDSTSEGRRLGITGTPSSIINNKFLIVGALPFEQFQAVINKELSQ